jgi:alkaline phosphatase D
VPLTRRQFLWSAAATAALRGAASREAWSVHLQAQANGEAATGPFRHGVASGDPLDDRIVLWTRVTPANESAAAVEVRWRIAADERITQVVGQGVVRTASDRDFTVKVDAGGLQSGRPYYYVFETAGARSPVGRTRTLPAGTDRLRLASVCCSNYPSGFFNVYRCVANRADLDAVVHLGDYIYEFENGRYGDGSGLLRIPEPRKEAVTLADYRIRYATYRSDPDLQEAHRVHPFIAVWDDHELTNDAWSGGAANHNPEAGEGGWAARRAAAYKAYLEWMPIREAPGGDVQLYRSFRFGDLADLIMLDTRALRDQQAGSADVATLADPGRSILGAAQEKWLFDQLRTSQRTGRAWRLIGQQVMFSRLGQPGRGALQPDSWDGYPVARDRIVELLARERVRDLAILSGDVHSSWAFDVPPNPWDGYDRAGTGSAAVELVTPAVSSPPLFSSPELRDRAMLLRALLPHLKFLEGESRGYVLLDVTRRQLRSEWYFVPTVLERSTAETRAAAFVCERGSAHLTEA